MLKLSHLLSLKLLILLLTCSVFTQENSPWKWVHPTPQGNTLRYTKTFSSTTFYALGYAGTFIKTTNGGANWYFHHNVFGVQEDNQIFAYNGWFFDANTGIATGEAGMIARTTNAGVTWTQIPTSETGILYGVHFINSTTGFISTSTGGNILKTTNAGLNWTAISTGATATLYSVHAVDENNIYVSTTAGNIRYTTNGGTNWTIQSTGASVTLYGVVFKNPNTGWVCGSSTAIRVTTNAGANWTQTSTGLPSSTFYDIDYIPGGTEYLYVAGNSFYNFRSTNLGTTWDSVSIAGNQYYVSTQYDFDANGNNMFSAGAFGLMNTSTNGGANWVAHNYLGYSGSLNDIWCNNMTGKVIAVGSVAPVPIILSTNGGNTWNFTASSNVAFTCNGIQMLDANTGFVAGSTSKFAKTTNGGLNWDTSTAYSTSTTFYCVDFVNPSTGWMSGASGRVIKTTDGGASWNLQTTGITSTLYRIDMVDANTGYFVGSSGNSRKTTDGGTTWTALTTNSTATLYWIKMLNANSGYLCGSSGTLRRTTNGGTNWDTVATPFSVTQYTLSMTDMNNLFVAGSPGYTMRTSNGGANWQVLNCGGATMNAIYMKGYDSAFVAGSSAGVLKLYNAMVGGVTWNNEIPLKYTLSQNYPNPFNPNTTIKFGLPKAGRITLKIYDVAGREVRQLFDNTEINAGTVTYNFNASELASGVYFYSLIVNGEKVDTKKMILVK